MALLSLMIRLRKSVGGLVYVFVLMIRASSVSKKMRYKRYWRKNRALGLLKGMDGVIFMPTYAVMGISMRETESLMCGVLYALTLLSVVQPISSGHAAPTDVPGQILYGTLMDT
jgi:hypothetical protein